MLFVPQIMQQIAHSVEDSHQEQFRASFLLHAVHEIVHDVPYKYIPFEQLAKLVLRIHAIACCLQLLQVVLREDPAHHQYEQLTQ